MRLRQGSGAQVRRADGIHFVQHGHPARLDAGTPAYEAAKRLAAELTRLGCDIVTGGGPGLMRAADESRPNPWRRAGPSEFRSSSPFEQEVNPFVGQVYERGSFSSRLHHFMILSDAFVIVPGGIGTLLEPRWLSAQPPAKG